MIKPISFIALVAIGIGAIFVGTSLVPAFAEPGNVPPSTIPGCTGNPHSEGGTGDPHNGFRNPDSGNPHAPTPGAAFHC